MLLEWYSHAMHPPWLGLPQTQNYCHPHYKYKVKNINVHILESLITLVLLEWYSDAMHPWPGLLRAQYYCNPHYEYSNKRKRNEKNILLREKWLK